MHFGNRPIPMGRARKPEELTDMVRILCRPEEQYVTGQPAHLNGGCYVSVN